MWKRNKLIRRYKEALEAFNKALQINPKYIEAINNKVYVYEKLGEYNNALKQCDEILGIDDKNLSALMYKAKLQFNVSDIANTSKTLDNIFVLNKAYYEAWFLYGKVQIEEKRYPNAKNSFSKLLELNPDDTSIHLWHAYADYLSTEFAHGNSNSKYSESISSIIRNLERINEIPFKDNNTKSYILYFLGCFYFKIGDYYSSIEYLKKCLNLKCKPNIKINAKYLLGDIWNFQIKPRWWRWWLVSPIYKWTKRIVFVSISIISAILLVGPSIVSKFFPNDTINIEPIPFVIIISILFFIILTPNIQKIKAKDIEIDLPPPAFMDSLFPPALMGSIISEYKVMPETSNYKKGIFSRRLN